MGAFIALLAVPLALLNMFGGLIGGVWLLYLGLWKPVVTGLGASLIAPFLLSLVASIGALLFGLPGVKLLDAGRKIIAVPFIFAGLTWTHVVVGAWCLLSFLFFMKEANDQNGYALLLWAYSTALSPWSYLAQKEHEMGEGGGEAITVFAAQIGFILMVVWWFLGLRTPPPVAMFAAVLCLSVVAQTLIALVTASQVAQSNKERRSIY